MSEWGNKDYANNVPKFVTLAAGEYGVSYPSANAALANTILVTATRLSAGANAAYGVSGKQCAHTGWVRFTKGTGGRAGRIQTECLVALSNPTAVTANSGNSWFTTA